MSDLEEQKRHAEIAAKDEQYLNEDTDLVEVRDNGSKVSLLSVTAVLSIVAAPFLLATGIAFHAIKQEHFGNVFTSF